jgi:hypothetical protein
MNHLAKAVVDAFAFLELSDDDVVDPDNAVEAMEMLTAELRECSPAERQALAEAAKAELTAQRAAGAPAETLEFYETFVENLFSDE